MPRSSRRSSSRCQRRHFRRETGNPAFATLCHHTVQLCNTVQQYHKVSSRCATIQHRVTTECNGYNSTTQFHTGQQCNCTTEYQPPTAPLCYTPQCYSTYSARLSYTRECQSMLTHREIRVTDRFVRLR